MTLGIAHGGCPTGNGLGLTTSRAAPAMRPSARTAASASVLTQAPRAVLMRKAAGRICARASAPTPTSPRSSGSASRRERARRLESDGHITGYRALVSPASLSLGLRAFLAAELVHHETACIEGFERGVVALPDVCACYHVAGRFDYLLRVAVRDLEHLGRLIKDDIAAIPGVDKVETMLVYSEVKPDSGWPVPEDDEV